MKIYKKRKTTSLRALFFHINLNMVNMILHAVRSFTNFDVIL
ncbi:hypothetical protein BV455_03781 [Parageobacillus caldoxylosilyticus]|nr:hypothetical protein BV455_03781 [Parageobacillus caldoxylosilyticus]